MTTRTPTVRPDRDISKLTPIQRRVIGLIGWPAYEAGAKLLGRKSSLRAWACAQGSGQHLPDLPPIAEDESLRCAEERAALQRRRLAGLPLNTNRDGAKRLRPRSRRVPTRIRPLGTSPELAPNSQPKKQPDPLARLVEAWPSLPKDLRSRVSAMVEAVGR